ncbi:MAG: ferritin family protein [Peptococcaceae bacterium]|nr:ferritin family protein [Peptococcaceae bacterium]
MDKDALLEAVIKTAMANEEKGARFYSAMAGRTDNVQIKSVFEKLSREELDHKAVFGKVLGLGTDNGGDIDEKEGRLLISLIKTGVFENLKEEAEWEAKTPLEAIALGIQAEKDSILLYQGIYNQVKSQTVKDMMSRLLEEEKMHLVELREQMEEMVEGV